MAMAHPSESSCLLVILQVRRTPLHLSFNLMSSTKAPLSNIKGGHSHPVMDSHCQSSMYNMFMLQGWLLRLKSPYLNYIRAPSIRHISIHHDALYPLSGSIYCRCLLCIWLIENSCDQLNNCYSFSLSHYLTPWHDNNGNNHSFQLILITYLPTLQ